MTLQRLLGTELPLIQAPMAGVQGSALALAGAGVAPLRAKAESQGSGDFSPLWCGQIASGCIERWRGLTSPARSPSGCDP